MFIEIGKGISVSSKHIEAIEAIDDLNCIVHTTTKSFEVTMPKNVILRMIGTKDEGSSSMNRVEKLLVDLYKTQSTQVF